VTGKRRGDFPDFGESDGEILDRIWDSGANRPVRPTVPIRPLPSDREEVGRYLGAMLGGEG
jgi:hypothetical protein